jgi:hypothetical protein
MTAYRNIAATPSHVALPLGTLIETPGQIRVTMPHNARTRGVVRAILDKLDGAAAEWFSIPAVVDDAGDELVLDYALEASESMAFPAALPRFLRAPAVHLPELVGLARYLEGCAHALERTQVSALIAPACLRYAPAREGAWRLLVVPLVDVSLTEWAQASPDAWGFAPAAKLLAVPGARRSAAPAGAYEIGAALATALVGELTPPQLATNTRFVRALRGWVGQPAKIQGAAQAALPASFAAEASALAALIVALLAPSPPADWRDRLEQLAQQLAPHRTAVRWEHEGRLDLARGILERLAASTPRQHVPWDAVARVRSSNEDIDGALGAAIDALGSDDHAVRELAAIARRIAHAMPPEQHRPMIERAVAAVDQLGAGLGELGRLHFAHLEARYLERFTQAASRLDPPAKDPWNNVVRETVLARIHAARGEWAHVARRCKQARSQTVAMPNAAGRLGTYVVAYLDYLDGVAHCGAVRVYRDPGYLADAFDRLVASLSAAHQLCGPGDPLLDGGVDWLYAVAELAEALDVPDRAAIHSGVVAYLGALGLTRRISEPLRRETPPIAWYDAGRLLALSGAP